MLDSLKGQACWSVIAGAGTGSAVRILIGGKILRAKPVPNPKLSAIERVYDGEMDLFVTCAWRLERTGEIVCGSTDDDRNDGPMVSGLSQMVAKRVVSIEVSEPLPDVAIEFTDGLCLRLFCDQTNLETDDDNYSVKVGGTILAVGARARLSIERTTDA